MMLRELLDKIPNLHCAGHVPVYATSPENRWQRTEVTDVFIDSDGHLVLEVPEVIRP